MKKILILASNPRKDLNLNREIYFLRSIIESSRYDSQFEVVIGNAVRPEQLQELFREHRPRIVHFSGHGEGAKGLVMEDDVGQPCVVSTQALSNLFKNFAGTIECVLLNACYSEVQANAITEHINYVIGMNQAIQDKAAIDFTRGFYQAMGDGESIEQSHESGCNEIELKNNNPSTARSETATPERKFIALDASEAGFWQEHQIPVLKKKSNLTAFPVQQTVSQNELAEQRYQADVQNDLNLGQASPRKPSLTQQEYRDRQSLLEQVESFWIKGVLEKALHKRKRLKLDLEIRADAVQRFFHSADELPTSHNQSLEWLTSINVFEQMGTGRTLLILGEPGSGKTIELLNLAKRLIERTKNDLSRPIPVVFNLSSWTSKRQSIADWLVEELQDHYRTKKSLGKKLVKQEELLLLLDGLDNVREKYRNDCVRALNQFLEDHSTTEMVVCSRWEEYKKLSERLKLRSAIYIRPITPENIDSYLDVVGSPLAGLKTVLKQDKKLEEFAQSPLILNVMSWAYHGYSATEVLNELSSADQRRQRLFDTYIKRMFDRKELRPIYSSKQTERWLTWLAQRMNQTSQEIFLIEKMQPNWLKNRSEITGYKLIIYLVSFLISLPIYFSSGGANLGLNGLVIVALIVGLIFELSTNASPPISPLEKISWSWQRAKSRFVSEFFKGVRYGSILGLILGLIQGGPINALRVGLIGGLIFGLINGLIFGVRSGLVISEIIERTVPNQGIRASLRNSLFFVLIFGLIGGLTGGLTVGLQGLNAGLLSGGIACIQHFILRWMLYQKNRIPWNYEKFLDFASERQLMKKVGGGYMFLHRMLLEHFARMNPN
ncbi:NACHT domain-containing protein [Microcoleus vaginatus]|uniref:NACHT domain-containing protein n=1 Tax=Microcoleus vaginatus TaxID=119532 RepID=UPI001682F321|nr:NACHT domain-containing protein [Microcoleus sp. FACHB-84]